MNIQLTLLRKNTYLVIGDDFASVITVGSISQLAIELNAIARKHGHTHDIYWSAIDKALYSPTFGRAVLLVIVPGANYKRVPVLK
jgi:hypothetical protein